MRAVWRYVLTFAVLSAVVVGLAGPAAAGPYPPSSIKQTLYLAKNPPAGAYAREYRSIYLTAGTYYWSTQFFSGTNPNAAITYYREIYLASGTYDWACTLRGSDGRGYYEACSLDKSVTPESVLAYPSLITLGQSGTYGFGSRLLWLRP